MSYARKVDRFYIGIDTGVNTGLCIWDAVDKTFITIATLPIHKAMAEIESFHQHHYTEGVMVRVEDARLRKWFGNAGREQLQGAGSIKRDAKIWEDFLTDSQIPFEMVAPKSNTTKLTGSTFKILTKWPKQTTVHSRDAAMLVYHINANPIV